MKAAAIVGLFNRPAGEYFCDFRDVALGITAVYAECVEFQEFASVIFVQTVVRLTFRVWIRRRKAARTAIWAVRTSLPLRNSQGTHGVRSYTQPIVQVEQHGRTLRRGEQQIFEFSQRAWANHFLLVVGEEEALGTFAGEDVEVIEPEIGHHFFELAIAVDRAQQLGLN